MKRLKLDSSQIWLVFVRRDAIVYAGFDKDKAFAWLEKADADHSIYLAFLKLEPMMDSLHDDPRCQDLERRAGVSQ